MSEIDDVQLTIMITVITIAQGCYLISSEGVILIMRSRVHHSHGITHSLTPFLEESHRELAEYELPSPKRIHYTPLYQP